MFNLRTSLFLTLKISCKLEKDIYKGVVSSYPILEIKDDFSLYSSHRGGRVKLPHERVKPTQEQHIPSTQMLKPCSRGHRARLYLCTYAVMPCAECPRMGRDVLVLEPHQSQPSTAG